jgi:hypothetical protein
MPRNALRGVWSRRQTLFEGKVCAVEGLAWGALGVAVCGLVGLGFVLIFLWKVYKAGGKEGPEHMRAAASALREARWRPLALPSQLGRRNVASDLGVDDDSGEKPEPFSFEPPGT